MIFYKTEEIQVLSFSSFFKSEISDAASLLCPNFLCSKELVLDHKFFGMPKLTGKSKDCDAGNMPIFFGKPFLK